MNSYPRFARWLLLMLLPLSGWTAALPDDLAGTRWRLVQFQSMSDEVGTLVPSDPHAFIMTLNADGSVAMQLDCNSANGRWNAEASADGDGGQFGFETIAATAALCAPPNLDERIARDTRYVRSYTLRDGRLHLSLMADGGIYSWEPDRFGGEQKIPYASTDDGGPRVWEVVSDNGLNLRQEPAVDAPVLTRYAGGSLLDNLGCREAGGRTWCDVQALGGGARGFVAAEFLRPAIGPDGGVATGQDDSALRAGQGQFDATGMVPCAWNRGQPSTQCNFGVARAGGGDATVVITRPDGPQRVLFFHFGRLLGTDSSQASGFPEVSERLEEDLRFISVGDERYEIPDAVIYGG